MRTSRVQAGEIRRHAFGLGFSHIGIAPVQPLDEEGIRLGQWLSEGYHASMRYMERGWSRRLDVRSLLPEAASVISLAMNYYSGAQHGKSAKVGKISRYAWGEDYHRIIRKKLEELKQFLRALGPDVVCKVYVDTGPVLEKAWAARAGIGWMGKHTNIITRDCGSWIFLGEILTSLDLEYDHPVPDFCGECTRCIDACPTAAIVEPYVVDSRRCISFHTIESKECTIPGELGGRFSNWIFGCDICQDVCPWNRFQRETTDQRFHPRPDNLAPALEDLGALTPEEFDRMFAASPVRRAGHRGFLRNVENSMRSNRTDQENTHHGE